MDAQDLLRRYATGERNFAGADLSGANLSRVAPNYTALGSTPTSSMTYSQHRLREMAWATQLCGLIRQGWH